MGITMAFGPLLDLRSNIDSVEFRALLLLLVGWRNERDLDQQRLDRVIEGYRNNPKFHVLGFERGGNPIAMAAIEIESPHAGMLHQIVVRTGSGKRNASVALWTRFASGPQGKAQNLPMIVGASLAALVLLSTAVSLWSLQSTSSIRAEYEDISIRARALQKQSQSSRKNRDLASLSPVERAWALKETLPAAVLVLEALTRALPDSAYLTELHLENATLRITGLAADAPSLIAALEQSGRFSDVHFFAPTAKGTEGALYRFHIEGQVDAPVEMVGD